MVRRLFLSGGGCFRSCREPVLRSTFPEGAGALTAGSAAPRALGDFGQSAAVAAAVTAEAILPRGRDAELPGPGGCGRGRQGHPALPADWGGRQVSFGGAGRPDRPGPGSPAWALGCLFMP